MPINSQNFPIMSFEQNNPVLSGFHQSLQNQVLLQQILKQKIANAIAQQTMQYAPQQAQASLQNTQLGNIGTDIGNQQNQLGLDVAKNELLRKGLLPSQTSEPFPSEQNNPLSGTPSISEGENQKLPLNNDQIIKLKKIFGERNVRNVPEQMQQQQGTLNSYQQNQSDYERNQALAGALGLINKGGTYATLAQQARQGTPQQQRQLAQDTIRLKEFGDEAAQSQKLKIYLNDMKERLAREESYKFYPGIRNLYSKNVDPDFGAIANDAGYISSLLPHTLGIPAKGLTKYLETKLGAIAGNPNSQLKGVIESDIDKIEQLADWSVINHYLAQDYKSRNGDLARFKPYGGDFKGYFNSKEEFQRFIQKLPHDLQKKVHEKLPKRGG